MPYKTLINLWPNPEYKDLPETVDQEKARLKAGGDYIELIERTDYQRVIRFKELDHIRVQGTQADWELTVQTPCSLANSVAALQQIAFYAISGARIPESLADHFAEAVDAMAVAYGKDVDSTIDDSAAARNCLNVFGRKFGILAGHRRPAVSFHLVGYYYDRMLDLMWDEVREETEAAKKEGTLLQNEIHDLEHMELDEVHRRARQFVKRLFKLSEQQLERYLKKHELWMDWRGNPPGK